MEHVGYTLALCALITGVMSGLYRQYALMLVNACALAFLAERGEAAHHWVYSFGSGLIGLLICSLVAAHVGFLASRWIPWALKAMGAKKAESQET